MGTKKRKPKVTKTKNGRKIDIGQILLHTRQVFLFGVIDDDMAGDIVRQIIALDKINNNPIVMYINSPGGSCSAGFSIIDAMLGIKSPIVTMIIGKAFSMAGLISIAGKVRTMTENSMWMAHDVTSGDSDYVTKMVARVDGYLKPLQKRIFSFLGEKTKLTNAELEKARTEELFLTPQECIAKGIVDQLVQAR